MNSRLVTIPAFLLALTAGAAFAGIGFDGWAPRAGARFGDPNQFVVGGHVNLGEIAPGLRLQPMVDVGFGDNLTLVTINSDALYFPAGAELGDGMRTYIGAGLAVVYTKLSLDDTGCDLLLEPFRSACEDAFDTSSTDVGLNLIGGLEKTLSGGNTLIGEFRITIEDATFFQITAGYGFGR